MLNQRIVILKYVSTFDCIIKLYIFVHLTMCIVPFTFFFFVSVFLVTLGEYTYQIEPPWVQIWPPGETLAEES